MRRRWEVISIRGNMKPNDWLFKKQCAEKFGDVLALFNVSDPNPTLASSRKANARINDEILGPLLNIASRIFLTGPNFDNESYDGSGRYILEMSRRFGADIEFQPQGEFVDRFRNFWLNEARSPTARGEVLLLIDGNSNDVMNIFGKTTGFAFVPRLSGELGTARISFLRKWLTEGEKRIAVFTRTRSSMIFMATPSYMNELMDSYEELHLNMNNFGSTASELREVPVRVENFILRRVDGLF
jgi:hypothetical protein